MTEADEAVEEETLVTGWQGRFFDDFSPGQVYRHPQGRTVSEADNTWFTLLTNNSHQAHFNTDYASKTPYGQLLVNSCLTLAIVTGLTVSDLSENAIANLGWEDVQLPNPVFVGDTLYAESRCLATRPSKSRPGCGIVRFSTRGFKQDGTTVMTFERSILVYGRDASPRARGDR
ncbi:MAG: MaoC family dehydratase [Solirubrobacterales bacterium]